MRWFLICVVPGLFHTKIPHTSASGEEMVIITTHYGKIIKVRRTVKAMVKHFFASYREPEDDNNDNN